MHENSQQGDVDVSLKNSNLVLSVETVIFEILENNNVKDLPSRRIIHLNIFL